MAEAENVISINGKDYTSDDLNDQQQYLIVQIRDLSGQGIEGPV